jgi:hypothetical protein
MVVVVMVVMVMVVVMVVVVVKLILLTSDYCTKMKMLALFLRNTVIA